MRSKFYLQRRDFQKLTLTALLLGMADYDADASPPVGELNSNRDLKNANNAFAVKFLQNIESVQEGNNQVVSPFSIESALLMTMEGARNRTADEMGTTLGLPAALKRSAAQTPWAMDRIRNDMKSLLQQLGRSDSNADQKTRQKLAELRSDLSKTNDEAEKLLTGKMYQAAGKMSQKANSLADQINRLATTIDQYDLRIANCIWSEKSYSIEPEFVKTVNQSYNAGVQNADFKNAAEAQRALINQWISDHTQQRINDLIPPGAVDTMTRMVLANAVYFRGTWKEPFEESQIENQEFFNHGTADTQVPMMSKRCDTSRYTAFNSDGTPFKTPNSLPEGASPSKGYPQDGVQVIELAYNGGDLSMIVALPTKKTGIAALVRSLTSEQIDRWESAMEVRDFEVKLPKFKLEVTYDLNDALQRQGMNAAFDPNRADFAGIGREGLFISKVLHKAFIEVNEKGTEAAAATSVMMRATSAPPRDIPFIPQLIADHPFLFLIRHRQTGLILFMGKVESL